MVDVRCDELEIGEGVLTTGAEGSDYENLSCCLDVEYKQSLSECFELELTFHVKIKNDDIDMIVYSIPFTLVYSLKKYEEFSLDVILKSAVNEVGNEAFEEFHLIVSMYFMKKMEVEGRRFH